MNDQYSQLVAHISNAISTDDYDQSEKLADVYLSADDAGKAVLDRAFICLCGYQLKTLMKDCNADDPTVPK